MTTDNERQAEDIFAASLELPTVDRPAAIRKACKGNAQLLERVQSFAAALDSADGFMVDATVDATADGEAAELPSLAPIGEKAGDTIGRYKLLENIGEGGFGVVFMAEQAKPVRRRVALKVIKLGMDTREVVARFEAERQALAMMDHPNIAKVLDAGATDTGRPYFVMELVRGSPVTEYADKHKLSTRDRVALAAQVCRAIQHAHSKGVIHRDIKPNNVLVTVADDKPVPKVIDFGIAKATQAKLTDRTLFTAHRQLIGTPQYMSPEQADSDGVDVDTRTDVYSLGVLIYELLVGTTPLDARSLRSAAFDAMRRMIIDVDPPRLSTRLSTLGETLATVATNRSTDAKQLNKQLHGELDWIVMRAMEKDRARRYDTAAALADDLNRYLAGEAVSAGPVSGAYRLKKTLKRYKAAVAVGSAIAACLLLGVAGTTWGLIREANQRQVAEQRQVESDRLRVIAVAAQQRATDQATLAEAQKRDALAQKQVADEKTAEAKATLHFFTLDILAKASPENTRDNQVSKVLVDALITPALATIDQRFEDQPLVRASIQTTLASTLINLGRSDLAEPQAKAAWDARRHLLGEDDPQTLSALDYYALAIDNQGRHVGAELLDKQLWDACRRVLGDDDSLTRTALNNYASAVAGQGRHTEAEGLYKQLWDADRRLLGDTHMGTILVLGNYAMAISDQHRYAEAEPLLKQCWDARRQARGDDHPETLTALSGYAGVIDAQGRHAEAEPLLKLCWDAQRRVLGDDNFRTRRTAKRYASTLDALGRHAEAAAVRGVKETLPVTTVATTGPTSTGNPLDAKNAGAANSEATALEDLYQRARAVDNAGRHTEAEPLLKQVWEGRRRLLGENHLETLSALHYYALSIDEEGRHADAEPLLKQCWDVRRKVLGDSNIHTLHVATDFANNLVALGRSADAAAVRAVGVAAAATTRPISPPLAVTPSTGPSAGDLIRLGTGQLTAGDHDAAEATFRKALQLRQAEVPANEAGIAEALSAVGHALTYKGSPKLVEAEADLRKALAIRQRIAGPKSTLARRTAAVLAQLLDLTGRSTEAANLRADIASSSATPATRP